MDVLRDSTFSSFEIYMDYNSMEIEGKKMKKRVFYRNPIRFYQNANYQYLQILLDILDTKLLPLYHTS